MLKRAVDQNVLLCRKCLGQHHLGRWQRNQYVLYLQKLEKELAEMSIQYTVLGFEPTTFENESPPITTRPGLPPIVA